MYQYRGVTLRPVVRNDMPMLFALLNDPDRFHLWGHRRICDEAQFYDTWRRWSSERMGAKFMILKHGRPIGLVFDYEGSQEDGHTKVATILFDEAAGRGSGVIATALFSTWLFENMAVRKIYLDVFGFNAPVIRMLQKLGIRQEMQRTAHRFWNGKYWDQHGFALYREDVSMLHKRLFRGGKLTQGPVFYGQPNVRVQPRSNGRPCPMPRMERSAHVDDVFDEALHSVLS